MLGSRDIELIESTINNGRIYFSASDRSFFPSDSFGTRDGTEKGDAVTFEIDGDEVVCDIRLSSGTRLSPRRSFSPQLKALKAKAGDKLRVTRLAERRYRLDHVSV